MPLYKWKPAKTLRPVFEVLQLVFPLEADLPIERRNVEKNPVGAARRATSSRLMSLRTQLRPASIDELLALEFFAQVPLSREELEGLVRAKDWKPVRDVVGACVAAAA